MFSEITELQNENSRLQEDTMNSRMELEISRTLVQEMEGRMWNLETSKSNLMKYLQSSQILASESNGSLAKKLKELEDKIASKCKQLEESQEINENLQD